MSVCPVFLEVSTVLICSTESRKLETSTRDLSKERKGYMEGTEGREADFVYPVRTSPIVSTLLLSDPREVTRKEAEKEEPC